MMASDASRQPSSTFGPTPNAAPRLAGIIPRDPLIIFLLATFALITYFFYTTDFRDILENFFYDTRIKWMPGETQSTSVVVMTIAESDIEILEKDQLRGRHDSKGRLYLSVHSMSHAASILANTDASAIALLMPEHAFPASDLDMGELTDIVKYDHRMIIGTTGYNQTIPNLGALPDVLRDISDQVTGYETFRSRSNAIVRSLPYTSFLGLTERETLPVKITEISHPDFTAEYGHYQLKHTPPDHFPSIPISDLIQHPEKWMGTLKDKIVVVGYTTSRDAGFQTTEQMMANTPLTGYAPTNANGISTTWLTANAIENLIQRETLTQPDGIVTLAQTITVAAICGISWELGGFAASFITISLWLLLIITHSFIYRYLSVSIPLADTFLATVLATIFAAIRRLKIELMDMAGKVANTSAKADIASIQSHFLSGFASWLKVMTMDMVGLLRESGDHAAKDPATRDLYNRAFTAGEDFSEYLEAIAQIPEMESISHKKIRRENIDLESLINTILRRFEVKTRERAIQCIIDIGPGSSTIISNPQLLDAIIFNFISNAIKYGEADNSKITIKVRRPTEREMSIGVIDRGPGIPAELRDRIFERFYRIRDERLYRAKGTGIGLYLCRFFAESMGGRVEVISDVGSGSEFRVVLPCK